MIKLTTDCEKCLHAKVCRHKGNAKNAMEKLKKTRFGKGPNDDYDWETMMNHSGVTITFSCPDFANSVVFR